MISDPAHPTGARSIRRGDVGPAVGDVRARLARARGDDEAPPQQHAELFDEALEIQVRAFQRSRGLAADGIVGPQTWRELVEAGQRLGDRLLWRTRVPMRGDDVVDLQRRLNALGFDAGPEDGIFGPLTQTAVEEFQRNIGLVVDGAAGPATFEMLSRVQRSYQSTGVGVRAREREALRGLARRGVIGARVLVDPAHGPADPGFIGPTGVAESEVTWAVASRLVARLQARGAIVDLSRGPRTTPEPSTRARLANDLAVDVVVSIEAAGHRSPRAAGPSSSYFATERFTSTGGQRLAELVQQAVVDAGWQPDGRTHPSTAPILRETRMPAVIVAPGFLTSPLDERRLRSDAWQNRLADALTAGVDDFFSQPAADLPAARAGLPAQQRRRAPEPTSDAHDVPAR